MFKYALLYTQWQPPLLRLSEIASDSALLLLYQGDLLTHQFDSAKREHSGPFL